jgi:hypothetical protein
MRHSWSASTHRELADALLAGDMDKASEQMSNELCSNLGPS